jgi:urocanate hydratase
MTFKEQIQQGIPDILPQPKPFDTEINHAPKRKEILSSDEKNLHFAMHCAILMQNIMLN